MNAYSVFAICTLSVIILILSVKILLMKRTAREITRQIEQKNKEETNTPITVSSADRDMRSLAKKLNGELEITNGLRRKYTLGRAEIQNSITGIAHDLRTPLTSARGYLELLRDEQKSETAEKYLDIIENRVLAMNELTEELFRYFVTCDNAGQIHISTQNITALTEQCIAENYVILKEAGITPEINLPEKLIKLTDPKLFLRVLSNIITNAAKYSNGDFHIFLQDEKLCFSNSTSGLSETTAQKLLDKYYTVSDGRKSTGLGLAIAKEIMLRLGGNIDIEYNEGILTVIVEFKKT